MNSTGPPVDALSAERLAAWVDASCGRADGLLFTASAQEDLEGIATWQLCRIWRSPARAGRS